jgi:hypothetical protein
MKMLLQKEVHPILLLTCFVSMMTKINENKQSKEINCCGLGCFRS